MKCDVCDGKGQYGIVDQYGKFRYVIDCPECDGDGEAIPEEEDETEQERYERECHEERLAAAWAIIQQNAGRKAA